VKVTLKLWLSVMTPEDVVVRMAVKVVDIAPDQLGAIVRPEHGGGAASPPPDEELEDDEPPVLLPLLPLLLPGGRLKGYGPFGIAVHLFESVPSAAIGESRGLS
jgi:hypothetical protein